MAVADEDWPLVAALRLAVLFHRSRTNASLPELALKARGHSFTLTVAADWLAANPLTETALRDEVKSWRGSGAELVIRVTSDEDERGTVLSAA